MATTVINSYYVTIPLLVQNDFLAEGYKGEFVIKSTENSLPIKNGDDILIIKPTNNDLLFANSAIVSKVGKKDLIKGKPLARGKAFSYENKDYYNHHFSFEVIEALKKHNKLSELEYSLPIIDNHQKPEVHFHSQYRTLPKADFETIVNGWVYATRTVFGKLINALPRQNRLEFMIRAMDHFDTIDFKEKSLLEGLSFLYDYIDNTILSKGRLLVATDGILNKELKDYLPVKEVGFIDPETEKVFNISRQAEIFRSLFKLEKEKSLKKALQETVKQNQELEQRFQKLFIRRNWPVNLEK